MLPLRIRMDIIWAFDGICASNSLCTFVSIRREGHEVVAQQFLPVPAPKRAKHLELQKIRITALAVHRFVGQDPELLLVQCGELADSIHQKQTLIVGELHAPCGLFRF